MIFWRHFFFGIQPYRTDSIFSSENKKKKVAVTTFQKEKCLGYFKVCNKVYMHVVNLSRMNKFF